MTLKNRIAFAKAYNAAPEGCGVGEKGHYQMECFKIYSEDADVIAAIAEEGLSEKKETEEVDKIVKKKTKKVAK